MNTLHQLVARLNNTEIRCFKQFAVKHHNQENIYIKLFDFLRSQKKYDAAKEKLFIKNQYSSDNIATIRAYLYNALVKSLNNHYGNTSSRMYIRLLLNNAEILFEKQLFEKSLKFLNKAKKMCIKGEYYPLYLEVLEIEREIQLIAKEWSSSRNARNNFDLEKIVINNLTNRYEYKELAIKFAESFRKPLENIDEKDLSILKEWSRKPQLSDIKETKTTQSKLVFHSLKTANAMFFGHWVKAYNSVNKELHILKSSLIKIPENRVSYVYVLCNALIICQKGKLKIELAQIIETLQKLRFDWSKLKDTRLQVALHGNVDLLLLDYYLDNNRLNQAHGLVPGLINTLKKYGDFLSPERRHVLYYELSYYYFAIEQYEKCLEFLDFPINRYKKIKRNDIYIQSFILMIVAHYELGNMMFAYNQCVTFLIRLKQFKDDTNKEIKIIRSIMEMVVKNNSLSKEEVFKPLTENLVSGYFKLNQWRKNKID